MREVGVLIWVVFIVIGVIANIASSVRKQAASGAAVRVPPQRPSPAPPPPQPPAVRRPQPRPVAAAVPPRLIHEDPPRRRTPFFADAPSVVRAVITAEVLGKPRALRDE